MSSNPIVLENVSHAFGRGELRKQVLFEIDAEIREGEIVLFTGPSGSGKTTLLTLVGALRSTQEGSLRVLGRELRGARAGALVQLRREIGYIFQSHNLIESLTAEENVLLGLRLKPGLTPGERQRRAAETLAAVGLADFRDRLPRNLSGGQRQRVAIARALAPRPRLVLADEPTASLDRTSGREVIEIVRGLARSEGVTVLLVTHDDRILDVADRILHLEDGRLSDSYAAVVASSAGNLMASLAHSNWQGQLAEQVERLPDERFNEMLEGFTAEARGFLEAVRLSQSEAHEALLDQVLDVFTRKIGEILDADRATLFLVDWAAGQLWSKYAETDGAEPLEIRIPLGEAIAGTVAATGRTMNVPDAYREPLFDPATDRQTGYRTRSILCVPILDAEGEVIAVAQVLNKQGGEAFDADDERQLTEFAEAMSAILESWRQMSRQKAPDPGTTVGSATRIWEASIEALLSEGR
ncbi:MAG: ATP-binding cassette domain-containing protein [bacterium]|nr:ATP-binding cassette domain-containing protein [bacterium]